ncbi:MAG: aspartate-semialdehyde dehydrogenase [Candidatus Omnitrophica bacterium]|nr:aspartate-semialdehyde dehydrogenase [Candidatus Omnitrophota bacterium]MBU1925805.1 aspartate-semialdehyde dehydrogenase [Candidatus Omnitrophota bacterium]
MKKKSRYNVAVVGVGAVGVEMLRTLKEHKFPIDKLRVFARSKRKIEVDGIKYQVDEICADAFRDMDFALFAGTEGEKGAAVMYAREAKKYGAIVIDNGADFRMKKDVPLVVPEVNASDARRHQGIIANPNCSTIQMVTAIAPIHWKAKIKRIIAVTYQASSGAGRSALNQLWQESEQMLKGRDVISAFAGPELYKKRRNDLALPAQIAFNVIPHIGGFGEFGYTSEEWKMVEETHKILHTNKIKISATCVRVPVLNSHAEAIYLETQKHISPDQVRKILRQAKGIIVKDDVSGCVYPMPIETSGRDEVFVGRIRKDPFIRNGLWLWVVSDNLKKGAATNAVQIAEYLIGKFK